MTSFGDRLSASKGIGPGFDIVRLTLALAVLFVHRGLLGGEGDGAAQPLFPGSPLQAWAFDLLPVPMFFALSGFLVAASAERLSVPQFLVNRILRIVPALAMVTLVSALVIGPLFTVLPLADYLRDPRFSHYLLNAVGSIHEQLPGLFESNPQAGMVNGSLWTVPHEFSCYLLLAGCCLLGLFRQRRLMLLLSLLLSAVSIGIFLCDHMGVVLPLHGKLVYIFVTRGAAHLIPYFLAGVAFYQFRSLIPNSATVAGASVVGYVTLCAFGSPDWQSNPIFCLVTAPMIAYAIVYAGLSSALKVKALSHADYSYGIYLYGYPLQQALIQLIPWLKSVPVFFLLSALAAGAMAALSWHLVEKPVLGLRKKFSLTAQLHTGPAPVQAPAPAPRFAHPAE